MWRNKKSCALGNGLITKTYFYARVGKTYTNNFEKHEYMLQNGKKALIHYLGNEKSYVDRCHGNSTKSKSFFHRSSHYVFDQVLAQGKNKPMDAYRSLLSNDPGGHISTSIISRNPKQVANIMTRNAEKNNFHNKDEVWNSHLVAYSIHPFVRKIESYPDICIVMCCEKIVTQMEEMLELLPCKEITLHYDTTFNLGNYYLSCLAYRHVCLERKRNKYLYSSPTVPFAFFIHEKRLAQNHKYFFQTLKENVCGKNFNKSRKLFISDREFDGSHYFDNTKSLVCWNHLLQNVKEWMGKNGKFSSSEYDEAVKAMKYILRSNSVFEYESRLKSLTKGNINPWNDQKFQKNYIQYMHSDVISRAAAFVLAEEGIKCPNFGVTNNASESLNKVIKDLIDNKITKMDSCILAMNYLSAYFHREVEKGYYNVGLYQLSDEFAFMLRSTDELSANQIILPDDIVKHIKETEIHYKDHNNISSPYASIEMLVEKPVKSDLPKLVYSISSLAKDILNKNGVVIVPQNRSWSVKESETIIHSVNLNPPAHCTCGASKKCVHILAVQYLSGNVNSLEHFEGKKRNLTSLIQKNRLKVERKSGKKNPRKCDIDSNLKTLNFCELAVPKNESFSIKQNEQSTVPEIKYPIPRGLQWGVGLVLNSCTIDNTLTMLKLRCHADKYFLNRLGTSEAEIELKKAMRYLNNDDDNYGKEIWACFLKSKIQITSSPCFNLYGSSKTFFFNHFKEAFTFESVGKCFTCLNSSFHPFDFIELPPNHDPTDYLLGYLKDKRLLLNCLVCGNKELNHCGTTLKSQNTWMIVIECDIPNISISSLMNLPKKILIEKCYFSLACITLGLNAHFTSLHYIRDQWFFYDGMQKNGKLTKMIPYNWQNKVANHVIYLID
nr:uncharacterized protein LOC124815262 [Hydra vulgaris]